MAVAAIPVAAATVISSWMSSKSTGRAARSQKLASEQALNYQRSRAAIEDQRYQARWDDYLKRHAAWEARQGGGSATSSASSSAAAGPQSLGDLARVGIPTGATAAVTAASPTSGAAAEPETAAGSLGEIAREPDWTDWRRYYPEGM